MIWKISEKKETEIQNTVKGYSSRIEQAKHRISELQHEIELKGKTEEKLLKQLKIYERNMQELTDSIKRPNLRIMGIEEEEEVQAKGIHNIFNKIITEKFSKSRENYAHSGTESLQDTQQT
jgi:cephalosporin-C deacetylase-like acetyl esterase